MLENMKSCVTADEKSNLEGNACISRSIVSRNERGLFSGGTKMSRFRLKRKAASVCYGIGYRKPQLCSNGTLLLQ